jgi:hypothetical protein
VHSPSELAEHNDFAHNALKEALNSIGLRCINEDSLDEVKVVKVTLRLPVGQSVCLGIELPCGTCDQILFLVGMLLSEIYGLISVVRPF